MSGQSRSYAAIVALAAMLLRALLPDGWMPQVHGGSGSFLTICTGSGLIRLTADAGSAPHSPAHHPDGTQHTDICPFAAAPHYIAFAGIPAIAAPNLIVRIERQIARRPVLSLRQPYLPQTQRGPPHIA